LQEETDVDKDNEGFEKLSGKGNKIGVIISKIRESLINIIKSQKTFVGYGLKILLLIGFIIYFAFAMSVKYGTPAFPIKGNVFSRNSGIYRSMGNRFFIN
jgi:hypothetical protein